MSKRWPFNYDPWPPEGKWFRFTWELPFAYHLRAAYLVDDPKNPGKKKESWQFWVLPWKRTHPKVKGGTFHPYLSVRIGRFGFYIGCKPVNLQDRNFVVPEAWRKLIVTEFSMRWSANR